MNKTLETNRLQPHIYIAGAHALNTCNSADLSSPEFKGKTLSASSFQNLNSPLTPLKESHYHQPTTSPSKVLEPLVLHNIRENTSTSYGYLPDYKVSTPHHEVLSSSTLNRQAIGISSPAPNSYRDNYSTYTASTGYSSQPLAYQNDQALKLTQVKSLTEPKKPKIMLNFDEVHMETNEFANTQKIINPNLMAGSKTPLPSSNIRTMAEIMDGNNQNAGMMSVRAATSRALNFHGDSFTERISMTRSFLMNDPVPMPTVPKYRKSQILNHFEAKKRESFMNMQILSRITSFLSSDDIVYFRGIYREYRTRKEYQRIFKHRLRVLLVKGFNDKEQLQFWNSLLNFRELKEKYPFAFTSQFVKKCPYIKDINKDLDRTLPEYDKYSTEKGREALLKVLVAISNTVKDVGYIQGLNSISGAFLFYLNEEKSYWVTLYMLEKLKIKDILQEDFHSVHILNYQLNVFLSNYVPEIANIFGQGTVDLSYFTTPWFITVFSYLLTLPNTIKAWNFFFLYGNSFLIQLALAVFSRYRDRILNIDIDELGSFFKYDLKDISQHDDGLFEDAFKFRVSKRLMHELQDHYHKGKPKLTLINDSRNKLQWKPIPNAFYPSDAPRPKQVPLINLEAASEQKTGALDFAKKFGFQTPTSARGKEFVQNIVNKFTVDLPEAFKGIFAKSPEQQTPRKANMKTEPTDNTEGSFLFDTDSSKLGTLTNLDVLTNLSSPAQKESRARNRTECARREALYTSKNNNSLIANTAESERQETSPGLERSGFYAMKRETSPNYDTEQSFRLQVSSMNKKSPETPSSKSRVIQGNESLFAFRPQTRLDLDPVTPSYTKKHSEQPWSFPHK